MFYKAWAESWGELVPGLMVCSCRECGSSGCCFFYVVLGEQREINHPQVYGSVLFQRALFRREMCVSLVGLKKTARCLQNFIACVFEK